MGRRECRARPLVAASMLAVAILAAAAQQSTPEAPRLLQIPLGLDLYMPVPEDTIL